MSILNNEGESILIEYADNLESFDTSIIEQVKPLTHSIANELLEQHNISIITNKEVIQC